MTSIQPSGALEDIAKSFKKAFCLNILVCGRTGVGKSSLINSLVGSDVCKVNDPGVEGGNLDRGTTEVTRTNIKIDNVFVTIYDSPGLQDGTDDEEKYLQKMYDKCKDVNLVLYCMEMTSPRYTSAEIRATQLITNKFGAEFWKRSVLVMTKANMVRIPPSQKGMERDYHQRLYNNFMKKFHDQLIEQGVNTDIANQLPGVAAGIIMPEDDEERYIWYPSNKAELSERPVDYLSELWLRCFERTANESQAKFLRATTQQRKKPLPVATEAEQKIKKELEESKKQMEELMTKHNTLYAELERNFKRKLEEVKRVHQPPPPSYQPPQDGGNTGRPPKTGRATAGAMMGATAGGAIFGPPGAIFGGILGFLLGEREIKGVDVTPSLSSQPPKPATWKLAGVKEFREHSIVVYASHGQDVEWNGLRLHIHAGSLPGGLKQCTIFMKVSLAGEYEFPENSSPVSGIFWLRCEPHCTFTKPVTVEIQHCSTKLDPSNLQVVRAFCSQKSLPYKFKPLGGRFNADSSYGAIETNGFSGLGVVDENSVSNRLYYNQIFYCSNQVHQHGQDFHIIYTWNTQAHINYVLNDKYSEEHGYHADYYQVIQLEGDVVQVRLEKSQWTKVMDGQWGIYPVKPMVTKAELDDFKTGRGVPNCVLETRPLVEQFPRFLHEITLSGVKPPYNELVLRLCAPPRIGKVYHSHGVHILPKF